MTTAADHFAPPPYVSHWRRAALIAIAVGCALYFGSYFLIGRGLTKVDDGTLDPATFDKAMLPLFMTSFYGPAVGLLLFTLWFVFRGSGRWYGRLGFIALVGVLAFGAVAMTHNAEGTRMLASLWGVPAVAAAIALPVVLLPGRLRWLGIVTGAAAAVPFLCMRVDGTTGQFQFHTSYRWEPSAEQRAADYLARGSQSGPATAAVAAATPADWPSFRGAKRDSVVPAEAVAGWSGDKPRELWRHPVGPAWSSFVGVGDYVFTQEQQKDGEAVVCYRAATGERVWAHRREPKNADDLRHEDFPAGPGPRATPTVAGDKVYAIGATTILSCLRAADGKPVWAVDLKEALQAKKPMFGYAASPLVVGGLVIVNPSSKDAARLAAFDAATGEKKWAEGVGAMSYSSPHLAVIDGVEQVLIFDGNGFAGHDPHTGKELWQFEWSSGEMEPPAVQPLVLPDGRVIVGGGGQTTGTHCVRPRYESGKWAVDEVWMTKKFTPKFNDSVVVGDHLYGLDGSMVCVSLKDGKRVWKDGKYAQGQLLLAGGKLLVVSEDGKLACVDPSPQGWKEVWSMDALKGKSWNHMAVARGRLFVRNAEEAAAFDLTAK